MRQVAVLSSGCQIANKGSILFFNDEHIFYASTLAVYVINAKAFTIEKILSLNQKAITSIAVSPHDNNRIAVSSMDGSVCLWDVAEESIVHRIQLNMSVILAWNPHNPDSCAIVSNEGAIKFFNWDLNRGTQGVAELLTYRDLNYKLVVTRWNPNLDGQIAFGCSNGTVLVFNYKVRAQKVLSVSDRYTPVVDLQWDRLSTSYLLVAYQFFISLWDAESAVEIHTFEKQAINITSIAWLDWTAGNFVSSNARNSNLKVWNASQKLPLDTYQFAGDAGVNCIYFCRGKKRVVCAGDDGSISVMNIQFSQLEYRSSAGHTETIFDCKMSPQSANIFSTASYDSTVKVWNTNMQLQTTLYGTGDVIYCCDWSPSSTMIVASSVSGQIMIWDVDSGRALATFKHHKKASYCVAWNQHTDKLICSTSADGTVVVFQVDDETLTDTRSVQGSIGSRRSGNAGRANAPYNSHSITPTDITYSFTHPAAVYGCAWSPSHAPIFATGCQDGAVRVFNHSLLTSQLVYVLRGCLPRTFGVCWSPLLPGYIASSGDDNNIHIWEIDLNAALQQSFTKTAIPSKTVLTGHTAFVRGLCWNYEHQHLLLSGSWDSSIRLWDAIRGTCLYTVTEHIADVYAITSHPQRPFTYLSASRDTTVRMWELEGIFALLRYSAVWDGCLDRIVDSKSLKLEGSNNVDAAGAKATDVDADNMTLSESIKKFATTYATHNLTTLSPLLMGPGSTAVNSSLSLSSLLEGDSCKEESSSGGTAAPPESDSCKAFVRKLPSDSVSMASNFYKMYSFFNGSSGSMELWENVLSILSSGKSSILRQVKSERNSVPMGITALRPAGMREVYNEDAILNLAGSAARKIESTRMTSRRSDLSAKMETQLRSAAMIYARTGDFTKYCATMVELNDWTAALAIAPSVSLEFWRNLSIRYAAHLMSKSSEQCIPHLLGCGKDGDAVDFYLRRNDIENAMVVAKMSELRLDLIPDYSTTLLSSYTDHQQQQHRLSDEQSSMTHGVISQKGLTTRTLSLGNIDANVLGLDIGLGSESIDRNNSSDVTARIRERTVNEVDCSRMLVKRVAAQAAAVGLDSGRPLFAAVRYLSINDVDMAISILAENYEPDLAYSLALCFEKDTTPHILELADRCASLNALDLALDMLSSLRSNSSVEMGFLLSRYCNESNARKIMKQRKLPVLSTWLQKAEEEEQIGSDGEAVASYVAARKFARAVSLGLDVLARFIRDPFSMSAGSRTLLRALKFVRATELDDAQKLPFLCFMLWFGASEAIENGHMHTACNMLSLLLGFPAGGVKFPILNSEVRIYLMLAQVCAGDRAAVALIQSVVNSIADLERDAREAISTQLKNLQDFLSKAPRAPVMGKDGSSRFGDGIWGYNTFAIIKLVQRIAMALSLPNIGSFCMQRFGRNMMVMSHDEDYEDSGSVGYKPPTATVVQGSLLPASNQHLKLFTSFISNRRIQGRAVPLNDQGAYASLNEAISWRKFMPFSPMMDGTLLYL